MVPNSRREVLRKRRTAGRRAAPRTLTTLAQSAKSIDSTAKRLAHFLAQLGVPKNRSPQPAQMKGVAASSFK
jgi:hypothetical protein